MLKKPRVLFSLLCLLFLSCKSPTDGTTTTTAPTTSVSTTTTSVAVIQPKPGTWTSSTDFGSFDFVVNDASTYITKITFNFSNWMGRSGGVSVGRDPGWAISNRTFTISTTIINDQWTIDGTFDSSGSKASGTWKAIVGGQTVTGTWQGQPKS